ncbi:MAG: SIMPL domain-containing protein, partial [Opitutales bacterium]|nr:SIMPL domain-containing protein [Opitutales bacterium]
MKKTAVFCSAILACALVACAAILVNPSVVFRSAGGIKVKGTAVERVQSDAAEWGARICTRAPDLRAAAAEAEKFAALAKAEFEKHSVRCAEFSAVSASPVYKVEKGAATNVVEGYAAALSISVSAKSREEIANVEAACSGLLKSGVPIFPEEARYYYTGLESLKMRLLEAAAQNARKR